MQDPAGCGEMDSVTMAFLEVEPLVCVRHKGYKGIRRPIVGCPECWAMYLRNQMRKLEEDEGNVAAFASEVPVADSSKVRRYGIDPERLKELALEMGLD